MLISPAISWIRVGGGSQTDALSWYAHHLNAIALHRLAVGNHLRPGCGDLLVRSDPTRTSVYDFVRTDDLCSDSSFGQQSSLPARPMIITWSVTKRLQWIISLRSDLFASVMFMHACKSCSRSLVYITSLNQIVAPTLHHSASHPVDLDISLFRSCKFSNTLKTVCETVISRTHACNWITSSWQWLLQ